LQAQRPALGEPDRIVFGAALHRVGFIDDQAGGVPTSITLNALAYPSIRLKPDLISVTKLGNNCRLSSNSGLPAIAVPSGFTPDGLPVGVELLGRAWSEPLLVKFAYMPMNKPYSTAGCRSARPALNR
jgi:Amidase